MQLASAIIATFPAIPSAVYGDKSADISVLRDKLVNLNGALQPVQP